MALYYLEYADTEICAFLTKKLRDESIRLFTEGRKATRERAWKICKSEVVLGKKFKFIDIHEKIVHPFVSPNEVLFGLLKLTKKAIRKSGSIVIEDSNGIAYEKHIKSKPDEMTSVRWSGY